MDTEAGPDDEIGFRLAEASASRGVRVGVAGWSYPDWVGVVYPTSARADRLAFIARYFDTVEVNSPFYRIPSPATTASWPERTRENGAFRFTVKLFRGFTHDRSASAGDDRTFHDALAPLVEAGALGALLLQFPWSFKNEPGDRAYLTDLLRRFSDFPLVVEVRHRSWNQPEFYSYLHEHGVGFCNIDQPVIGRSLEPTSRATSAVGYVRLHGRNYSSWFSEDAGRDERYDYLYSPSELDPWIDRVSEIRDTASQTFVITNNHYRGQAVVNALQIRARLERRRIPAPRSLVERYPSLESTTIVEQGEQRRLF